MDPRIAVVLDGPTSAEPGRFVEVENELGASINVGKWERDAAAGVWRLWIDVPDETPAPTPVRETSGATVTRAAFTASALEECAKAEWVQGNGLADVFAETARLLRAADGGFYLRLWQSDDEEDVEGCDLCERSRADMVSALGAQLYGPFLSNDAARVFGEAWAARLDPELSYSFEILTTKPVDSVDADFADVYRTNEPPIA
jgi:hypothetical protein